MDYKTPISFKNSNTTTTLTRAILSLPYTEYFVKFYIYYEHPANYSDSDFPAVFLSWIDVNIS